MDDPSEEIETAVRSGDPDRVNGTIAAIEALEIGERVRAFDACIDRCRELYRQGDGYQRQSIIRILEALTPAMGLVTYVLDDESRFDDELSRETFEGQVEQATSAYVEGLQDEDGRVRLASVRALKLVCVSYDVLDEEAPIRDLVAELDALADEDVGPAEEHIRQAREQAAFHLRPPGTGLADAFRDVLDDSA